MKNKKVVTLPLCIAATLALPDVLLAAEPVLEEMIIIGVRDNRVSRGATGLSLDIRNTPQSISVIDQEMMRNFGANNINDALDLATGVRVERWETNRTNYQARGFEIKSTQIDGVGLPNNWGIVTGAMDAFGYEKLEIIRGANGLLTGVGNASGTINYVRKRPSNTPQGQVNVTAGSFDMRRVEADYSSAFTDSGNWAGRAVLATEESDSWLDGLSNDRTFAYGVVDGQLTTNATLAFGYSYQVAHTDGNMWGGLIFSNSDGTQAEWDRSATTTQNWTMWDTVNQTAFIEYNYRLPNDWNLAVSYNHRTFEDDSKLFFASTVTGLDPVDGTGLTGWPGAFATDDEAQLLDANLTGAFALWGGEHEAIVGINHSSGTRDLYSHPVDPSHPGFGALPGFPYAPDSIPEPAWGAKVIDSTTDDTLTRYYGAVRFSFGRMHTIVGANVVDFEREASTLQGAVHATETSPYMGVSFDVTDYLTAYASYSDIYQPQDFYDIDGQYLAPTKGVNYELGLKGDVFDGRLLATLAVFKAEQKGLGTFAGLNAATGQYYYIGQNVYSEGFEAELTGRLTDSVNLVLGYTALALEDDDNLDTYTWVPRDTVNLAVTASLPGWEQFVFGLSGKWQSDIYKTDGYSGYDVTQDSFLMLDASIGWHIDDNSQVQLNVNNLTDEKYISSLFEIGYYGSPRNVALGYRYSF